MSNEVYESSQCDDRPLRTLSGHTESIWTMAYLPGGQRLVTGSSDKTIRIWMVGDGRQEGKEMVHAAGVMDLAVTSDGRRIISADDEGNITVWDVATQERLEGWRSTETNPQIAISADDRLLAYGNRTIIIQETNSRRIKQKIMFGGGPSALCFSCDGSKLAIGTWEIMIHNVEDRQLMPTLKGHSNTEWSRDSSRIYSASLDGTIRCWNTETGKQIGRPWTGHTDSISSLSLSQDGTKLASGSYDQTVRFWDTSSGHPIGHPLQHEAGVLAVCIAPSNDVVAAAGNGGKIMFWRVPWRSDENQSSEPTPRVPSVSSEIITPTHRPQPRNTRSQIFRNPLNYFATAINRLKFSRTIRDDPQDRPREPTTNLNESIESRATLNVASSRTGQIVQLPAEPPSIPHTSAEAQHHSISHHI